MQTQLDSFRKQRHLEFGHNMPCAYIHGAISLPLASLTRIALSSMLTALSIQPRSTYDIKKPPASIECYRLSQTHITVPRSFGYARACAYGSLIDTRVDGKDLRTLNFKGILNAVQIEAFEKTCSSLNCKEQSCILTLPCGFGKTVVALRIAHVIGKKTLVVVHKDFLLSQWKARLEQFLPEARVSILQGTKEADPEADFVIAMLQTLCLRLEHPDSSASTTVGTCGLAIIDEAHHMAARSFSKLFFNLPVKRILGLTATPHRKDGCTSILHMFMGDYAFVVEGAAEHAEVPLVHFVTYASPVKNSSAEPTPGQVQKIKTDLTEDAARNRMICDWLVRLVDSERHVICLSDRLVHLSALLDLFTTMSNGKHKASLFVGGQKKKEREFAEKECNMLFGTYAMAQEGLDVPRLDTLVLASPASDITQSVGRILRPCASKKRPLIIDIQDDKCLQFTRQNHCRCRFYAKRGIDAQNAEATQLCLKRQHPSTTVVEASAICSSKQCYAADKRLRLEV